jgi:hypothetical protein
VWRCGWGLRRPGEGVRLVVLGGRGDGWIGGWYWVFGWRPNEEERWGMIWRETDRKEWVYVRVLGQSYRPC